MDSLKTDKKRPDLFTVTLLLLIALNIFEFTAAPTLLPNFIPFRTARIIILSATAGFLFIRSLLSNKIPVEIIYLHVLFIIRIWEIISIFPRVHSPGILMSLMILSNFLSIFIIIFLSYFFSSRFFVLSAFCLSIVYQVLYFRKLYDLSPIILILTIATTIGVSIISGLLKLEQRQKTELDKLYKEEVELKNRLALVRGRMLEQEKSFSMSMMTAGIAHEIGNPLNHLQGNLIFLEDYISSLLAMIDSASLDDEQTKKLSKIKSDYNSIIRFSKEGFRNLTGVIQNIKQLYGSGQRGKEKTSIKELVDGTIQFFRTVSKGADYLIETVTDEKLYADIIPGEYFIVITNLLKNAAESFTTGSGDPNLIRIESASYDEYISIRITDNGCGIPAGSIDRCFDPFFSTKNNEDSLGLGLALCREIIRNDGNDIIIESTTGLGTRVELRLKESV